MAHVKETPRQKMIGMMYLVLLALLALNVSKQVLDAFDVIDGGLVNTIQTIVKANRKVMKDFESQYELNKTKVGPWQDKAKIVHQKADSIFNFIQSKKIELVIKADGPSSKAVNKEKGIVDASEIESKDNPEIPGHIMIGDNNDKAGRQLRKMMESYREYLVKEVVTAANADAIRESIKSNLNTKPSKKVKGGTEVTSWESEHFEQLPLSGVVAIMSGLQINVRNAETEALRYLYNQIEAGSFKFNQLIATIIPSTNYVIRGNAYHAEVFLAASDTTASPAIFVTESPNPYDSIIVDGVVHYQKKDGVKYTELPVVKGSGKGIYDIQGSSSGNKYWGGIIELTGPDGSKITKPFKRSYLVAESSVSVAPTKMNVFYLGVDNPVDVSVAGVSPDKISIDISNASYTRRGNSYIVRPRRQGQSTVTVYAVVEGKKRVVGQKEFRVKTVPDPIAKVNRQKGGQIAQNVLLAQLGVQAEMENFDFDLTFKVTQFTVSAVIQGFVKESTTKSNHFSQEQKAIIGNLNRGQNVYIQDIKAIGPDGSTRNLSTIYFKLN